MNRALVDITPYVSGLFLHTHPGQTDYDVTIRALILLCMRYDARDNAIANSREFICDLSAVLATYAPYEVNNIGRIIPALVNTWKAIKYSDITRNATYVTICGIRSNNNSTIIDVGYMTVC